METGAVLLTRTYYGGGVGVNGLRFLPDSARLLGLGYFGQPQFWNGTPVEQP